MQQVFLGFQVLLAVAIIVLVMLQQGRGADAGASFGGGASGSLFGSRGPASFLAKITGLLAAVFFINSIGLAYLAASSVRTSSVVERVAPAPDTDVPVVPGTPAPGVSDSVPTPPPEPAGSGGSTQ
jgi:preprotein translocase subunit SecG